MAQGQNYGRALAELMKGAGINLAVGPELAGSHREHTKGPENAEKLMKELSTNFQVLEKGRVPLRHGLPQMSHIRGHGINAEDAEKTFSIVAPASRGQEDTVLEAELRAIEEMKAECTGKELGVEKGMGRCESTNAVKRNIYNRKLDLVAVGNTDEKATVEVAGLLKQKDVRALLGTLRPSLLFEPRARWTGGG